MTASNKIPVTSMVINVSISVKARNECLIIFLKTITSFHDLSEYYGLVYPLNQASNDNQLKIWTIPIRHRLNDYLPPRVMFGILSVWP